MKAAVVQSFDRPPQYADFPEPIPQPGEVLVTVRAAALSQLVRAQASGKHYSAAAALPLVPGADGVGRLADGRRVYFAFPRPPVGAMAERVAVSAAYVTPLPDDVDDVTAAAVANPGMSAWAALTLRAGFKAGEAVLINGATGAAGRLAIQIAKHLGASRVVATGRNASSEADLRGLGADAFVPLDLPPAELEAALRTEAEGGSSGGVDVVLDYLWGASAERIVAAVTGPGMKPAPGAAARRVRFVNIGSLAGPTVALPAAALRSSGLELLGSGLGSASNEALVKVVGEVLKAVRPAGLTVAADPVPLA
ncbi:MAG: alcohol dehydrogenase, partial [Phycisphaerales bacterium]|nr:alcohol dehydrogenase [Phycisphaerales bacterium]